VDLTRNSPNYRKYIVKSKLLDFLSSNISLHKKNMIMIINCIIIVANNATN